MKKNIRYPKTTKVDTFDVYFGNKVADPYRWLEDDLSDKTKHWIQEQNKVTFGYLEEIPFRKKISTRLKEIWNYEKISSPTKHGKYYYYFKNNGLQNQDLLCRKETLKGEEEIFIDPNKFKEDGTISLAEVSFNKDGSLIACQISDGGSDWRQIIVKDTETGEVVDDTITEVKFSEVAWKGNEGFFYSSYKKPENKSELSGKTQYHHLFYHRLGSKQSEDKLIFGGEKQPRRYISATTTEDGNYLVVMAAESTTGNELYIIDLSDYTYRPIPVVTGFESEQFVVDNNDRKFLMQTNLNAKNNKLVEFNLENPSSNSWKDIIPETKNVLNTSSAGGYIFATYMVDVKSKVFQYDYQGKLIREILLPEIGTSEGFSAKKTEKILFYDFSSFTYPSSIYKYDIEAGSSELYWTPNIDFNPDDYFTEQVFYESKDGTKIPMYIVGKKGIKKDGKNPTYLYSYGGFNISLTPSFSTSMIIWLENGGIFAQPNIRGGGEYGESWHLSGTKLNKQNVFDDFISAAEFLISKKYTSKEYLAIAGGSNGGLLVGATMTQCPDLAAVALPNVGVLDMLRYHKFTAGAGWAYDYGTSEESEQMFNYLLGYSPLHNIQKQSYPATLITTGDHDDRVVPAHSFKFAATLQEFHQGNNPVLIRIETRAGHGAGKPTAKIIDEYADRWSFVFFNMGIEPKY